MFKATKLIQEAFEKGGLKSTARDFETVSAVNITCSGKQAPKLNLVFLSANDQNDFTVRVPDYIQIPEGKEAKAWEVANQCNLKYRYCKFTVDSARKSVVVTYDAPARIADAEVGVIAVEMLTRFLRVLDEMYPEYMSAMWA